MTILNQADICRGLGKPPQDFKTIDARHPLPDADETGVPRKDGTGARRYWHEQSIIGWAAAAGLDYDPARARR